MTTRTVLGYASLLSERSIKRLFPGAKNIRPVRLDNHARCFNSYGSLTLKEKLASPDSEYLAHASAIVRPGSCLLALAFDLNETDYGQYERHEFRYCFKTAPVRSLDDDARFDAILCYENVDHQIDPRLVGRTSLLDLYEDYDVTALWHTMHKPAQHYIEHCLAAAYELGSDFFGNFLDQSFLHDRQTTIRSFIESEGKDPVIYAKESRLSDIF